MSKEQVTVGVDIMEPDQGADLVDLFRDHPDVESWYVDSLEAGDIAIEGIGFERKTWSDFISSIEDGRLTEQSAKLRNEYEQSYILIEGDLVETESPFQSGMASESVRGAMSSLTARKGIPVIPVSNLPLLSDMSVRIARKHIEDDESAYLSTGPVDLSEPTAKRMYGCIEGVGPETAEKLFEAYPSMHEFVTTADAPSLQQIDGIGEKTAYRIIEEIA